MELIFELAGHAGVVCFLSGFFQLQRGKWASDGVQYLSANLLGAILLMASLTHQWNISAFVLEAVWALISLYGLAKYWLRRKKALTQAAGDASRMPL